ncbi:hypothetical protein S40288_10436, partial [Stachybotrys chartarum IBT 40288]
MITAQVAAITGLSTRQVNRIYSRAIERGFDPDMRPLTIRDDWLCDAPRSGRPRTGTEALKDELVTKVSRDRYAREKSCAELAVVQEDNAPAHAHHHQQTIYNLHNVKRLLWCPNSPDLNMIEPAWFYLKRVTTKLGAPKSRTEAIRVWKKAWAELSQQRIRGWVERIVQHIKE